MYYVRTMEKGVLRDEAETDDHEAVDFVAGSLLADAEDAGVERSDLSVEVEVVDEELGFSATTKYDEMLFARRRS